LGTAFYLNRLSHDNSAKGEIMEKRLLTTAAVITLLVSSPAFGSNASGENKTSGSVSADMNRAWKDLKEDSSRTYENIKTFFMEEEGNTPREVVIDSRHTATGMIGQGIYNLKEERIGTIKDILVDKTGTADTVIISDGEFPGFDGKLVAFDYGAVLNLNTEGDLIAPLTEENINQAAGFSYEPEEGGSDKVHIMPEGSISIARLLDGQLLDPQGEEVAEIDNIYFKNGRASQIVAGFDKLAGLGGRNALFNFNAQSLVRDDDDDLDFRLNAGQAARIETYKKSASK
jgi:hypothetical protein